MKRYINKAAFAKTAFESSTVGMLTFIAHPVAKEGNYVGNIYEGDRLMDRFFLTVSEKEKNTQVNVDLGVFNFRDLSAQGRKTFVVQAGGYILFYNSKQDIPYRITLERVNESTKKMAAEFDTQKLNKKDLFVVSLVRPGKYIATSDKNKTVNVDVPYPDKKVFEERNTIINPITVRLNPEGFENDEVRLLPSQGLIFQVEDPTSIAIRLEKEYTKPDKNAAFDTMPTKPKRKKKVSRKYRWENPKYYPKR